MQFKTFTIRSFLRTEVNSHVFCHVTSEYPGSSRKERRNPGINAVRSYVFKQLLRKVSAKENSLGFWDIPNNEGQGKC